MQVLFAEDELYVIMQDKANTAGISSTSFHYYFWLGDELMKQLSCKAYKRTE